MENEILEMFSMQERRINEHKLDGTKVCEAEEVKEYFLNPEIANEDFR